MYRILFVGIPLMGTINPQLAIAKKLIENNCTVDFINSNIIKKQVNSIKANLIPLRKFPNAKYNIYYERNLYIDAYKTALCVVKNYDLIIYDSWFFLGRKLSEISGVPCVKISSMFAFNKNTINDLIYSSPSWYMYRFSWYRKLMTKYYCKNLKISSNDFWEEMYKDSLPLTIVFTNKTFQPHYTEFDSNYKFVGPIISDRKYDELFIPYNTMKRPIIYVALGTISKNKKIIETCIKTYSNKDCSVLISLGNKINKNDFKNTAENIYLYSYVPQLDVLKKCDLFVTHGGMNSVNEAMFFGVPMIVCPQFSDQFLIAKQVESLNLGITIFKSQFNESVLREKTKYILSNNKINQSVLNNKKTFNKNDGLKESVELIQQFLRENK